MSGSIAKPGGITLGKGIYRSGIAALGASTAFLGKAGIPTTPPAATAWNPADAGSSIVVSNSNLTAAYTGAAIAMIRAVASQSAGKLFYSVRLDAYTAGSDQAIGMVNGAASLANYAGADLNGVAYNPHNGSVFLNNVTIGTAQAASQGGTVDIYIDIGAQQISVRVNGGNWNNSGTANPLTGVGAFSFAGINAGPYFPAWSEINVAATTTANFGGSAYTYPAPVGAGNWGTSPFGFYNFTQNNLPNWKVAKAAVAGGTRNAILVPYGDSTTAGFGSVAGGQTNFVSQSYPTKLAALLASASASSFSGNHAASTDNDARVSVGSWGVDTNATLGGFAFSTSGTTTFSFAPSNPIDTIDGFTFKNTGFGSFTVHVDGGASLATVNLSNATAGILSISPISVPLGVHTIQLVPVSGAVYIHTIRAYNSASKEISIMNAGASGFNSTQLSDSSIWLSALIVLQAFAPDLTIIEGGIINDWCQGIAVATSQTNLQAMITAAKRSGAGDVFLLSPVPSNPAQIDAAPAYAVQQTYVDMMKALAISNGIGMVDVWRLFGGTFQSSLMFNDVHPNGAGYQVIATNVNAALASGFKAA